jgi:hypothetical protein
MPLTAILISYTNKVHARVTLKSTTTGSLCEADFTGAFRSATFAQPVYPARQLNCLFNHVPKRASYANTSLLLRHLHLNNIRRYTKFHSSIAIFNNLNKLW